MDLICQILTPDSSDSSEWNILSSSMKKNNCLVLERIEVSYYSYCMLCIDQNLEFKSCHACIAKNQVKITALLTRGFKTS